MQFCKFTKEGAMSHVIRTANPMRVVTLVILSTCVIPVWAASAGDRGSIHITAPREPSRADDTFTRMFPGLPAFAPVTNELRDTVKRLGELGGVLDAKDLMTDPIQSILNPAVFSPNNPDNTNMTAGMTFLGQFIDHDLTLDLKSPLLQPSDPRRTTNF